MCVFAMHINLICKGVFTFIRSVREEDPFVADKMGQFHTLSAIHSSLRLICLMIFQVILPFLLLTVVGRVRIRGFASLADLGVEKLSRLETPRSPYTSSRRIVNKSNPDFFYSNPQGRSRRVLASLIFAAVRIAFECWRSIFTELWCLRCRPRDFFLF